MRVTLEPFDLIRDSDKFLGWLAQPHVAKWWGDAARAIQHARECVPESHALIVAEGTPVGYLCWEQPPKEELEAANLTDLPSGLVDIDILIGDPDLLGQGVGAQALELLLARLRREPSVAFAGLGTSTSNTNAIRCFEKAGFRVSAGLDESYALSYSSSNGGLR
jgi:aminoglycoside 6'-N-acetyltransferase